MKEHLESDELPEGLSIDDLRYVHPQLFPPSMAMHGWNTELKFAVDGNRYKVDYRVARPVEDNFGIEELAVLAHQIGVLDNQEQQLPDYLLRVDTFGEGRTEFDTLHDKINPHTDTSRLLIFQFCGFPTSQTMDIMQALEKAFQSPPRQGVIARILGKLGLR